MHSRYAVYYLPPKDSALAEFGAEWFGYDIRTGAAHQRLAVSGFDLPLLTERSRNYGLHATLIAPFRLKRKYHLDDLNAQIENIAKSEKRFQISSLKITELAGFTCLMPKHNLAKLTHLEESLVTSVNKMTKKPSKKEFEARSKARINALERQYLDEYGYPYVLDHFRFHITLCDKAKRDARAVVAKFLRENYSDILTAPLPFQEIALCGRRKKDKMFEEMERFPLGV